MRPLDQSILITSGTGVLRYIEEAEESPCRMVLRQTRIAGIVTISDLQKLPVRPALFLVVTHLEPLMAAAIRSRFAGQFDEAWLALLGSRRGGVEERWRDLNSKNLAIDRINATQFADKRRILIKSGLLQCSRSQAVKELSAIERAARLRHLALDWRGSVRCPISLAVNGSEHRLHPFPEGLLCLSHGLAVHPWSRALRNLTQTHPYSFSRDVMGQGSEP
jgi:hypothetical protein